MKLIHKILAWPVILSLLLLSGCAMNASDNAPELIEPVGMEPDNTVVTRGEIFNVITLEGIVLPYVHDLCFDAGGIIDEVLVTVGSPVKAGDVIARLDADIYKSSLTALESNLAYNLEVWALTEKMAVTKIEIAKAEFKQLKAEGAAASATSLKEIEITDLENKLNADKALWELTRADLEAGIAQLREQVSGSVLTAPCDGTIVYTTAVEGGYAIADSSLFRLAEDANLYISADYVTADQVDKALEIYGTVAGKEVSVKYEPMDRVEYLSRNDSGKAIDSTFVVSDAGDVEVESGMSAVIFIVTERDNNALIVPTCTVRQDVNGYFVYLVDESGTQIRRNIKRGIYNDAYVQILEGLEEGDVVYAGN